jgi:hypothetical protein
MWEENIRINIKEVGWEYVDWLDLAQGTFGGLL